MKKSLENTIFNLKERRYIEKRNNCAWVSSGHWLVSIPLNCLSAERQALVNSIPEGKCLMFRGLGGSGVTINPIFDQVLPKKRATQVHVTRLALEDGNHFNRKLASDDRAVVTYLNQDYLDLIQDMLRQTDRGFTIEAEEATTIVTFRDKEGNILACCMPIREDGKE